jgi:sigma-B regulation protein RsbU (phosphoserine phosphatase)
VIARVANHVARQQLEREVRRSRDRLERELACAGAMQRRILPTALPKGMGATFAAYYRTSLYAGGDYYDVFALPDGQFGVIVADVSGHGAPSAIVMAMIRAAVHAFPGVACDPAEMIRYLNRHFEFLWESPMFATALSALVDPREQSVTVACAGHPPPLLLRDGRVGELPCDPGPPLGLRLPGPPPPGPTDAALLPGDLILAHTDGVTEARSADGRFYPLAERLTAWLADGTRPTPRGLVDTVWADLDAFAGAVADDVAMLALAPGTEAGDSAVPAP